MQLKDLHPDVSRYLEEDCYCPHEIYDTTGFFAMLFHFDFPCELLVKGKRIVSCIATKVNSMEESEPKNTQIINFHMNESGDKIDDAFRIDVTQNNIDVVKRIAEGKSTPDDKFDEYEKGSTQQSLEGLFSLCDLIVRD